MSFVFFTNSWARPPVTFSEAKNLLLSLAPNELNETFYCAVPWTSDGKTHGCPEGWSDDDCKLEWDHVVPASLLGLDLPCWQSDSCPWTPQLSKRKCCQSTSSEFSIREADVYNIVPVLKKINRERSNFLPGYVKEKAKVKILCGMKIDRKTRTFEPPDRVKGWVARIYLRLDEKYHLALSSKRRTILHQWDRMYPASFEEKKHNELLNLRIELGQNKKRNDRNHK